MMPLPSPGRIVHAVMPPDGTCRAAIVTEVDVESDVRIGLIVFEPTELVFVSLEQGGAVLDELGTRDGTWHWPERVP